MNTDSAVNKRKMCDDEEIADPFFTHMGMWDNQAIIILLGRVKIKLNNNLLLVIG